VACHRGSARSALAGVPGWFHARAHWNPARSVTATVKDLFGSANLPSSSAARPVQHAVLTLILQPRR